MPVTNHQEMQDVPGLRLLLQSAKRKRPVQDALMEFNVALMRFLGTLRVRPQENGERGGKMEKQELLREKLDFDVWLEESEGGVKQERESWATRLGGEE